MMERNPPPVDTSALMPYALRLPSGFQIMPVNVVSHAGCNTATLSVSQCKRLYALGKNSSLFFWVFFFPKNKKGEQVCFSHTPLTGSLTILSMASHSNCTVHQFLHVQNDSANFLRVKYNSMQGAFSGPSGTGRQTDLKPT